MARVKKWVAAGLAALLCCFFITMPPARAAGEDAAPVWLHLPNSFASDQALLVEPTQDGWLLASVSQGSTLLSFLSSSGESQLLERFPAPYAAATGQNGSLYLAFPKSEVGDDYTLRYSTELVQCNASLQIERWNLDDIFIDSNRCLTADSSGAVYAINAKAPDQLRQVQAGAVTAAYSLPEGFASAAAVPGTQIVYTVSRSGALSYLDGSQGSLAPLMPVDGDCPTAPFRFITSDWLLDQAGSLYQRQGGAQESLSLFWALDARFACAAQTNENEDSGLLLAVPQSGDTVLQLDPAMQTITGQQDLPGTALALSCLGELTAAFYAPSDAPEGTVGVCLFNALGQPQPMDYQPLQSVLSQEQLSLLWQSAQPANGAAVFELAPDLVGFTQLGLVSAGVVDDGLSAANFYRTLYGLTPLQAGLENQLQAGAAVALYSGPSPADGWSRPGGMSDAVFTQALSDLDGGYVAILPPGSLNPAWAAIHQLSFQDPAFLEQALSPGASLIQFGVSGSPEQGYAVLVRFTSDQTQPLEQSVCFPIAGIGPAVTADLWHIWLGGGLAVEESASPTVTVYDCATGESCSYSYGAPDGLTLDADRLSFPAPSFATSQGGEYEVTCDGLLDSSGKPARLVYVVRALPLSASPAGPYQIESSRYRINRELGTISGISPSTSVASFRSGLQYAGGELEILRDGQPARSNVGTGAVVRLTLDGALCDSLTAVVYGDLTGEGNVNSLDERALTRHLLGTQQLDGWFFTAADLDHNGQVDSLDLLALKRYLQGSYAIEP